MRLLPYLHLEGDHVCSEIWNNCRTLAYMQNANNAGDVPGVWRNAIFASNDCDSCCCHSHDEGNYTTPGDTANNPAPWFDPTNPASAEAFGFLVDQNSFQIESARSARIRANRGARPIATADFSIVSSTVRGANYLQRWVLDQVDNCCRQCSGLMATVFETCVPEVELCSPTSSIQAGTQEINDDGEVVVLPFTVCYTPFEFGTSTEPTLFSNVCPGALEWIPGGSDFASVNEPTTAQLNGAWVPFGTSGCNIEIRGRDGADIPGERDIFRVPIDGVAGPVDGDLTLTFDFAQSNGDVGVGVYNFVTDTWIPVSSLIAPSGTQNLGTHLRMSGATATGPVVLGVMADGQEVTDLQLVAFAMGQGFNSTTATNAELINNIRFSWRGTQTVPSVEHGLCGGGWLVDGVNVDPATTTESWTDVADLTQWMNDNDPNGVVWVYDAASNQICSSIDLQPEVANQYGNVSGCGGQLMQPAGEGERFDPDPDLIALSDPSPFLDLGRRQLVSMRFTSIEPLEDTDFFGACSGERFRMTFEVVDREIFGDEIAVCSINTWRTDWAEPALTRVAGTAAIDCTNCGVPCRCQGDVTETGEVAEETCFIERPEVIRAACLTPAIPDGVWVPVIRLRNPSGIWIENARLRIVRALNNAPSILNRTQGALWYQNQVAEVEANIVGIAPGSTMILDGRNTRAEILCFNGETISGAGTIFGPLGRTFRMNAIGCGTYWLEVALSTADLADGSGQEYGGLDLEVDFRLVPVFGLI